MDRKKLLVVVDMQNDFIDGSLGTEAAKAVVDKVCDKIDSWDDLICYTIDTHYEDYLETAEGHHIPVPHCLNDSHGWRLNDEVAKRLDEHSIKLYKEAFGTVSLIGVINAMGIQEVHLIGVCTDICVISNALLIKSIEPSVEIYVYASCCAGSTPENHMAALNVMKSCCVNIVND